METGGASTDFYIFHVHWLQSRLLLCFSHHTPNKLTVELKYSFMKVPRARYFEFRSIVLERLARASVRVAGHYMVLRPSQPYTPSLFTAGNAT